MKQRTPKRLWVIVDDDANECAVFGYEFTRKKAQEHCARLNRMPGYAPTCRVVEFRPVSQHKSKSDG